MVVVSVLTFIAGFAIMAFQLVGGRILSPYFGSSIYVWGSIIAVFMIALAVGYLLGGRWSLVKPTLFKLGALFWISAALLGVVPTIAEPVLSWVFSLSLDPRYGALAACFILFLPASIVMGMVSPYCVRLTVQTTQTSGNTSGVLSFVHTIGSALGTLLTSFYLVALLEVQQTLYATAIVLVAGALLTVKPPLKVETQ